MGNEVIGVFGLALLVILLLLRVPVGLSLIGVSFGGVWILIGERPAWGILSAVPYDFAAKWTLSSIPMFLLMGFVCYHAGLTRGLFEACRSWMARLPGGLAIASVIGSAGFAAVTGSSVACAAAMGRIAVPEMLRAGYDKGLATGSIAAAGTLGALIPPSILLILFGVFAEAPIGKLFMGGVGAGLVTAILYIAVIWIRAAIDPACAPRLSTRPPLAERIAHLKETWPVLALLIVVIGGMFVGLFTATEAGAVGAFASIVIAWSKGSLTGPAIWAAVQETLTTTAALFLIAIGANLLTRFLALSGSGELIAQAVIGLQADPLMLILGISALYLFLGMFLDPIGAMLLTLPVLLPVLRAEDIDLIWFGVFLAKFLEIGMITPPVGLNVFVIKGVVGDDVSLTKIFQGILWFLVADAIAVALFIAFPEIITWLPELMD
ncbi:TRAP transporter, DctM subunit [Albimonas donghaensis]|uniref:TRAP transporter large permease protein n=1 Tax=Albimonas donghaensis TaxID=356660 RepID=A0A1H3AG13_9RHOB|nr:TRAP transporter large permease subunit [Albimonas donghaensis]SDX28401.1 TRAP transporter, DctM subunit [Albimonas donghaensis]